MKFLCYVVLLSLAGLSTTFASESTDQDIFAQRGEGVVTQEQFSARADRIPSNMRRETLRDGNRVRDLLNDLLLKAQLASAAKDAGFENEKIVQARMKLAAENELGEAWLQHYVDTQPEGDYEAMSREYYELNKSQFESKPQIDVSHILISNENRTIEEAMAIANEVALKLAQDPASFEVLVAEYSEDPSAKQNNGHFKGVKKGDMVAPFETVAFALDVGEISEPVQTRFGLHIIRLDANIASVPMSYEAVKEDIIKAQRARHRDRVRDNYLSALTQFDVDMTEEALEIMVQRQTGDK